MNNDNNDVLAIFDHLPHIPVPQAQQPQQAQQAQPQQAQQAQPQQAQQPIAVMLQHAPPVAGGIVTPPTQECEAAKDRQTGCGFKCSSR
jgi:hypothetical protein